MTQPLPAWTAWYAHHLAPSFQALAFDSYSGVIGAIEGKTVIPLAVAAPKRMALQPDLPTVAETLPSFEAAAWYAIVAPAHTPAAVAAKVNAGINEALHDPEILKRLSQFSAEPVGGTVPEAAAYFRDETERWKNVITSAHVTLD